MTDSIRGSSPFELFGNWPLLQLSEDPRDTWSALDAFEGTHIFGGTGSGKTTGSGRAIARALLRSHPEHRRMRFGGLVLTAKPSEYQNWREHCEATGRLEDLRRITPQDQFDFLRYECLHPSDAGLTYDLVSLFLAVLSPESSEARSVDPYWEDALRQLLLNAIDLILLAGAEVSLAHIHDVVMSAPQDQGQAASTGWQSGSGPAGRCAEFLRLAEAGGRDRVLLEQVADYWLLDFPGLAPRTRSIIVNSFTAKSAVLLREPFRSMLCCGPDAQPTFSPEDTFRGRVLVLDLPVKVYGEAGRLAQVIFKTVWQRAAERRLSSGPVNPVFLWADEAQYFLTSADALFQQTAREARVATVYLTQSISNYLALFGGTGKQSVVDSLLANFQTKIFHANSDPATNQWTESLFGQRYVQRHTTGLAPGAGNQWSTTTVLEPEILAQEFLSLATGSENGIVETIFFRAGRRWGTHASRPFIRVCFSRDKAAPVHHCAGRVRS